MRDAHKRELKVGDYIATTVPTGNVTSLAIGLVTKLTKTQIHFASTSRWYGNLKFDWSKREMRRTSKEGNVTWLDADSVSDKVKEVLNEK